ncbi:50S ribosomal protein L10 [Methanoplanus endosymbiosus]|uniref:Large ribosomal subunit protein uL10 n=1 Tax=Methanoplanus endosymbiosus TaxID=33865 RepID=A0A9E7TJA3_9EURY|nr:50S ribosomal protein L10 [Methanoplanus endosymbiosus]UUX93418.1 50S ribosomal protein L10 [Methanoplanus endosymbiosus]
MTLYTTHLPQWKRDEVEEIKSHAEEYKLIGLVDLHGIPASQMQQMRRNLRGSAVLKMTRNTLIEHAFTEMGGEIEGINNHIDGHSALIYTNENPFRLYKRLQETMTKMAAKPGDIAPEDISVSKGPTSFPPGPIVGQLQQAGIPAAITAGKVVIRETKTVVKEGEVINAKMADVLSKLDIRPIDVGMSLQIAFYEGTFFEPKTLAIDETEYFNNLVLAAQQAFNLSVNAVIPTATTAGAIIGKAVREARNLGVDAAIYEKDIVELIIGRTQRESLAVKAIVEEN